MTEAAHGAGEGLGWDQPEPSQAFTEKEMDSPQHCQRQLSAELSECDALKVQLEILKLKISLRYSVIRQLGGNECASQLCLSKLGDLEQVTLPL